ncbi:MAG TPA: hypothetical protein VLB47_15310 [Solirubrobacteraceae bacterium]|nr:hypothetical protein [Solirubrobacteraceae bacterium]
MLPPLAVLAALAAAAPAAAAPGHAGRRAAAAAAPAAAGARASAPPTAPASHVGGCALFPRSSPWHRRVARLPVPAGSDAMIDAIGRGAPLHADFGSGRWEGAPIGIPYTVVGRSQRRVPVRFAYADESDRGPYPIPPRAPVEGGRSADGDRHVIVVQRGTCRLFELFDARPVAGGRSWTAGSGATWSLRTTRLRPFGWTSADAAGLPILPGLARWPEVRAGRIDHALRITVPRTRRAAIAPARHVASSLTDPSLPAMGQRLRLKASVDLGRFPRQARVVLRALREFGAIVADHGSAWYVSGAPDRHWRNADLHSLGRLTGGDLEVVATGDRARVPR